MEYECLIRENLEVGEREQAELRSSGKGGRGTVIMKEKTPVLVGASGISLSI